jgi:hypothetical protein
MNSLIILLCLLFFGCNSHEQNSKPVYDKAEQKSEKMNEWQKDKNGCLQIRNKKLAEDLLLKYNLKNKSQSDFLKVFGLANEKKTSDNQQVLIYYFDSVCNENELVKDGDKCYAEFYFENDSLKKEIYLCE